MLPWPSIDSAPVDGTICHVFRILDGYLIAEGLAKFDGKQWVRAEEGWERFPVFPDPTHWLPVH